MAGGEQKNRRGESVLFMRVIRLDTGVDLPIVVGSIHQRGRMRDGEAGAGHLLIMNTLKRNQNSERKIFARDKVIIMEVLMPVLMVMKAVEQSRVLNSYCMITDHHVYRSYLGLLFFQAICYSCYQVTSHK